MTDHRTPSPVDELRDILDNFAIDIKFNEGGKFEAERNLESREAAYRAIQAKITEAYEKGKADAKK